MLADGNARKENMKRKLIEIVALLVTAINCQAQNTPRFISIKLTPENAIQLYWASSSNKVYEVDYADQLAGNSDGSTAWNKLYDDYPSQGTNTFIGDFGNYLVDPSVLNPNQSPMRFYRVVDKGTNAGSIPKVRITSITNGASLSGQAVISVTVTSSLPVVTTVLYVDGQKMDSSDDGTNFVINTCEWLNGSHVIYATAKAQSTLPGPSGPYPITIGRGVSPYVNVTFNNLISEVAFSQPFFEPSLGQTQQVTAIFAANVNWTLKMLDESSNAVRTVTGSGISLSYDWDGTGDGGTNLPDGVYYYLITAQTNGQPFALMSSMASSSLSSARKLSSVSEDEPVQLWALAPESLEPPLPFAIYPTGFNTNGFEFFEATASEMKTLTAAVVADERPAKANKAGKFMASASSATGGPTSDAANFPSPQTTVAPTRPPTKPVKNSVGLFGVAYFDHLTTNSWAVPKNGLQLPGNGGKIKIENSYNNVDLYPIPSAAACADRFVSKLQSKGWKLGFKKGSSDFSVNDLIQNSLGGNDLFGTVNLGLFIDHGSYGTTIEHHIWMAQSLQTYFPSANPSDASNPWIALSEFGFGGGNLRWMAILACNSLHDDQYQSIVNHGVFPLGSENHLICGFATVGDISEEIGEIWAKKMTGTIFSSAESVKDAWFDAGHDQYHYATNLIVGTVIFRVAGWDNCLDDTLKNYPGSTSGTLDFRDRQVYP
jgi:hypothetical protein